MKKLGKFTAAEIARKQNQGKPKQSRAKNIVKDKPVTYPNKLIKGSLPKGTTPPKAPTPKPKGRGR